ncbi:MAG: oligosaccharide flippase family protein [Gammaproteobacteria bacterium]
MALRSLDADGPRQLLRVIGGSAFIFACRVAGAGLTFGSQVILARWLGAAEFGNYVLAASWCILLSTVATAGMPSAAMRFIGAGLVRGDIANIRGFARRGLQVTLAAGVLTALLGAVVVLAIPGLVPDAHRQPMLVALATVPFFAVLNFHGGTANAFSWMVQSFLPTNVLRPLVFLVALWFLASRHLHLDATRAMELQWLVVVLCMALAGLAFQRRLTTAFPAAELTYETRHWLRTAVPLLGASLFTSYLAEITVIAAGFYLPSDEIGVFQVSYRIALLIAFGLYAVDSFTAPEAARLVATADHENLQRSVNRATRLRFWPALAAVGVLVLAGRPVLRLFGDEFVAGYSVLVLLAIAQLAQAAVGPVSRLMMLSGQQDRALLAAVGSLVLLMPLLAVLVPPFGMEGAAAAALLDIIVWSIWMRYLVIKSLGIRPAVW